MMRNNESRIKNGEFFRVNILYKFFKPVVIEESKVIRITLGRTEPFHELCFAEKSYWHRNRETIQLVKTDFLSSQKLLATIFFSKEISQVILATMVLAPSFYCKNCFASDFSYERKSAFTEYILVVI